MTGEQLAELMVNGRLKAALAKHARRYSKQVEDQEEYIQDAWIRIADKPGDRTLEWYENEGRKAIYACYMRSWKKNNVYHKEANKVNGNGKKVDKKPRNAVDLGRGRYINRKPESVGGWYYDGEWNDWVSVPRPSWGPDSRYPDWARRKDAEHHGIPAFDKVDESGVRKLRVNRIAVTRLSQVKTEADWEEYQHRKAMETHERLRHESGIGRGAYSLADPDRKGDNDIMESYGEDD